METQTLKQKLPTFVGWWEMRRKARQNRLPKHLRPPEIWPIWIQIAINGALIYSLYTLMMDKDQYVTDAGPAIVLSICLLFLISTVINGVRMKRRYQGTRGQRLSRINFWLMVMAFLCWPAAVAVYLP